MISYIKANYQNIYILLVSLMIGIWFNGINRIINFCFPGKTLLISIILCIIPITFFLLDDGIISELYNYYNDPNRNNDDAAAIISGASLRTK